MDITMDIAWIQNLMPFCHLLTQPIVKNLCCERKSLLTVGGDVAPLLKIVEELHVDNCVKYKKYRKCNL